MPMFYPDSDVEPPSNSESNDTSNSSSPMPSARQQQTNEKRIGTTIIYTYSNRAQLYQPTGVLITITNPTIKFNKLEEKDYQIAATDKTTNFASLISSNDENKIGFVFLKLKSENESVKKLLTKSNEETGTYLKPFRKLLLQLFKNITPINDNGSLGHDDDTIKFVQLFQDAKDKLQQPSNSFFNNEEKKFDLKQLKTPAAADQPTIEILYEKLRQKDKAAAAVWNPEATVEVAGGAAAAYSAGHRQRHYKTSSSRANSRPPRRRRRLWKTHRRQSRGRSTPARRRSFKRRRK